MEEKIREYVNSIFVTVPQTTQTLALRTNVTKSLINKYYKYIDEGKTPNEAYDIVSSGTQDIVDAIDSILHTVKNTAKTTADTVKDAAQTAADTVKSTAEEFKSTAERFKNKASTGYKRGTGGYAPYSRGNSKAYEVEFEEVTNKTGSPKKPEAPKKPDAPKPPEPPKEQPKAKPEKKITSGAALGIGIAAVAVIALIIGVSIVIKNFSVFHSFNDFLEENNSVHEYVDDGYYEQNDDFEYSEDGIYHIDADEVDEIELVWKRGNVIISAYSGDEIVLSESTNGRNSLVYEIIGGRLSIEGNQSYYEAEKTLNILIPYSLSEKLPDAQLSLGSADLTVKGVSFGQAWISSDSGSVSLSDIMCEDTLSVRAGSADTDIEGDIGDISFFSNSGDLEFRSSRKLCTVDASSTSGDIALEGNLHRLKVDTGSGKVDAGTDICPYSVEITSSSGNVKLRIPEESDFVLEYNTSSGKLSSKLTLVESRGKYVRGDGIANFKVDTGSADLKIEKFE